MKKRALCLGLLIVIVLSFSACVFANNPAMPSNQNKPSGEISGQPSGEINDKPSGEINDKPDGSLTQSKVKFTAPPSGVALYNGVTVKVQDSVLPLYSVKVNNAHSWDPDPAPSRADSGVGYFFLEGNAQVSVTANGMTSCVVRPLSAGVTATVKNNVATFTISSAGEYSVEPNGDAQKAIFLFVSEMSEQTPTATTKNIIRFEKGIHNRYNSKYFIEGTDTVWLNSDTTVILEDGAVVQGRFQSGNASNITICGTGIIDGSTFVRNFYVDPTLPLVFSNCKDVTLKDFSVLDPAGWCVQMYFSENSSIDNIKIITSRPNCDGISLQSCKHISVSNCFIRSWDDSLVIKNYPVWENREIEGETEDITFTNCALWTDLGQSMEIGYETIGSVIKDITFKNITVLHNFHKPVMSIHNGNNANITNVKYDTITVEDASMGQGDASENNQLIEFAVEYNYIWSQMHKVTALGNISNVTVSNVAVLGGNRVQYLRIVGSVDDRADYRGSIHTVSDVTLSNVWLSQSEKLVSGYGNLVKNEYTSNIVVDGSDDMFTAPFVRSLTPQQASTYTQNATVTVI